MVKLKNEKELALMRQSGKIAARALRLAGEAVQPGVTTLEIDEIIRKFLESQGAKSSDFGYCGFPRYSCISVNEVVVHGVPSKKCILKNGDIVSIDVTSHINGYHGDNAKTFACGEISLEAKRLVEVTENSLFEAIKAAKVGARIGDIGSTVQKYVESRGYSVTEKFVGHGIGTEMHEDPKVPNLGIPGHGQRLLSGMTLAIEPMVNQGTGKIKILNDGWSAVTADGKLAAHFEHTIAITNSGPEILTNPD